MGIVGYGFVTTLLRRIREEILVFVGKLAMAVL